MGRAGIVVGLDLLISQIMRKKERERNEVRKTHLNYQRRVQLGSLEAKTWYSPPPHLPGGEASLFGPSWFQRARNQEWRKARLGRVRQSLRPALRYCDQQATWVMGTAGRKEKGFFPPFQGIARMRSGVKLEGYWCRGIYEEFTSFP